MDNVYREYPEDGPDTLIVAREPTWVAVLFPAVELAFPLGEHLELTLGGNAVAGLNGRW